MTRPACHAGWIAALHLFGWALLAAAAAACTSAAPASDVQAPAAASQSLFIQAGCGGCHTLAGVPGASGVAGPNLTNISLRPFLVDETIPNSPETLTRWLLDPQSLKSDARMPAVGLTEADARELAVFLFAQPSVRR